MSDLTIDGIPILMSRIDLYETILDPLDRPYRRNVVTPEPGQEVYFDLQIYDPENECKIRFDQPRFFLFEFTYRNVGKIQIDARVESVRVDFTNNLNNPNDPIVKLRVQGYGVI
jgi:hypothetical protein